MALNSHIHYRHLCRQFIANKSIKQNLYKGLRIGVVCFISEHIGISHTGDSSTWSGTVLVEGIARIYQHVWSPRSEKYFLTLITLTLASCLSNKHTILGGAMTPNWRWRAPFYACFARLWHSITGMHAIHIALISETLERLIFASSQFCDFRIW